MSTSPEEPRSFDPEADHRVTPTRWFEDFRVGERFLIPSRTMTEGVFAAFQAASGDNHPIHYDREYCRRRGHRDLLAHGFQCFIQTAIGAGPLPHEMGDSLKGMIAARFELLGPLYCGDTVYPTLQIAKLEPQTTTGIMTVAVEVHNQDGAALLKGEHRYLLRKRPRATP